MDQFKLVLVDLKGGVWWETVPACLKVLLSAAEGVGGARSGLRVKASDQSSRTFVEELFSLFSFSTSSFAACRSQVRSGVLVRLLKAEPQSESPKLHKNV